VPFVVADVPETGKRVELTAETPIRAAIAATGGLVELPRFEAAFDLTQHGRGGVHVVGRVQADVVQNCVVTLEPLTSHIDEEVDLVFQPSGEPTPAAEEVAAEGVDTDEPPEVLQDGKIDLGALATEFLLLGIDPYPRREGVSFDAPPAGDPASHPFAALAALKKDPER